MHTSKDSVATIREDAERWDRIDIPGLSVATVQEDRFLIEQQNTPTYECFLLGFDQGLQIVPIQQEVGDVVSSNKVIEKYCILVHIFVGVKICVPVRIDAGVNRWAQSGIGSVNEFSAQVVRIQHITA
jgi:hypothetical protein